MRLLDIVTTMPASARLTHDADPGAIWSQFSENTPLDWSDVNTDAARAHAWTLSMRNAFHTRRSASRARRTFHPNRTFVSSRSHKTELATAAHSSQSLNDRFVVENASWRNGV